MHFLKLIYVSFKSVIKFMNLSRINAVYKFNCLFIPDYIHINKVEKVYRYVCSLFFIFITPVFALLQRCISPLVLIRVGKIYNHRLGHFILEFDWYKTNRNNKMQKYANKFPIYFDIFFFSSISCNSYLEQVVKSNLNVVPREIVLGIFLFNKFITKNTKYLVNFPTRPTDLSYLDDTPPNCVLSSKDIDFGKIQLMKLGFNPNQEIVCFFIRDASYEKKFFPEKDHNATAYRNSSLTSFEKSMEFLAIKGFIVVRMGKTGDKPLEVKHPNIIDYPFSTIKNDFMDFYLSYECKFAVATDSGAMMLPVLFRKPIFLANVPGFHGLLQGKCITLFQFKTFINLDSGGEMRLRDLLQRGFRTIESGKGFELAQIGHSENSTDEIYDSIIEMLELLKSNSNVKYQKSQQRLNLLLKSSTSKETTALLCNSWIEKHPNFLD